MYRTLFDIAGIAMLGWLLLGWLLPGWLLLGWLLLVLRRPVTRRHAGIRDHAPRRPGVDTAAGYAVRARVWTATVPIR